jgi:hypothetical protein
MADSFTYKVAETRGEREAAFRLVYEAYRASGLIEENPFRMRVTPYLLVPTTAVFLAVYQDRPVYTVSLVVDNDLGLPLEELYPDAVIAMRRKGLLLAEVSCLAGRPELFDRKRNFENVIHLKGLMLQYARYHGIDRLMLAVHPRHAKFYSHFWGCQIFGEEQSYDAVEGNPAVGCFHDFADTDRTGYRLRDQVYEVRFADWELLAQPMSRQEREYLAAAAEYAVCSCLPTAA